MAQPSQSIGPMYQYGMNTAQPRHKDFSGGLTGPGRLAYPQGENTYTQTNPAGGNYSAALTGPTPTAAGSGPINMSMYSPGRAQPTQTPPQGSPYQTAPQSSGPGIRERGLVHSPGLRMAPPAGNAPPPPAGPGTPSRLTLAPRGVDGNVPNPQTGDWEPYGTRGGFMNKRTGRLAHVDESGRWQDGARPSISVVPRAPASAEPARPQPRPPATTRPSQENPFAGMQPGVYSPTGQFYGGDPVQGLSQAQRQRDAFVMQMNQATLPYQMANVFGQDLGAPNYDFQGMLGRANKMVEDGFYNPFTQYFNQDLADQMSRYAPPSMYRTDRGPRGGIYT